MKKHLIAAAVAAAVAAPAMAQNVSLFGILDASVQTINKANAVGNVSTALVDSAISSSQWGMRGSEDLGGGLKAIFELAGDAGTNNGGHNGNGLFRRAAYAGVQSAALGELTLGIRLNPVIAANTALMPVSGNSVSTVTSTALGFDQFFTRNAITYVSPVISGVQATAQYGASNTVDSGASGTVTAWRLSYSGGPFSANVAGQSRKGLASDQTNLAAANAPTWRGAPLDTAAETINTPYTGRVPGTADAPANDINTLIIGARYQVTQAFTVAAARIQNEVGAPGGVRTTRSASQYGVGYQYSPSVLLGGSITSSEGSRLTNMQARYSLSKRTTAYAQYAIADNDVGGVALFFPTGANTNAAPATVLGSNAIPTAGVKQSAAGVGLIHTF